MSPTVLIVDDEPAARFAMRRAVEAIGRVVEAGSISEGRLLLREERPDVILLDHGFPDEDGLSWLEELKSDDDAPAVIMITAHGSERLAVDAMKLGAYDYLAKPYDVDELRIAVRRASERQELRDEVLRLRDRLAGEGQFGRMTGASACMQELFQLAGRIACSELPVLIVGESGVGKDVLAQEIHSHSQRASGPFVPLNCAALPESLVESELFGYEKGAFTNALTARAGRFEQAHRGTLFLDEIAEMSPGTQAKILRVVESGSVERLGSHHPVTINVRLISATNKNIAAEVAQGRFREDLYFRLAGAELRVPPLHQRLEDIPLLAAEFWSDLARKYAKAGPELTSRAMNALQESTWPGNIRQLRSVLERLFVLSSGSEVTASDVVVALGAPVPAVACASDLYAIGDLREARRRFEIEFLTRKLREHSGNLTRTAAAIGMARQSLQEKLHELGIPRQGSGNS